MKIDTLEARVIAGMCYLDAITPGWKKEINVEELDLRIDEDCVLGQLYGSCDYVELTAAAAYALGFHIDPYGEEKPSSRSWKVLTETWKKNLKKEKKR